MLDTNFKDKTAKQAWMFRYENVTAYQHDALIDTDCSGRTSRKDEFGPSPWLGSQTWAETETRFKKGYPEGTAQASKLVMRLTPFLRTVKGTRKGWRPQRYAGGNFILDNYVKGIPELCNIMSPVNSKKFASLLVNCVASSGVSTEVMQTRGVAVLALTQILQTYGYRVSVKLTFGSSYNASRLYNLVDLKPFHQTMDVDRLAFFLADSSAFRRLYFSWEETRSPEIRAANDIPGTRGHPCEIPASEIGPNDIYLGCASYNDAHWRSLDKAQDWIKETLKRYGVEFYG